MSKKTNYSVKRDLRSRARYQASLHSTEIAKTEGGKETLERERERARARARERERERERERGTTEGGKETREREREREGERGRESEREREKEDRGGAANPKPVPGRRPQPPVIAVQKCIYTHS